MVVRPHTVANKPMADMLSSAQVVMPNKATASKATVNKATANKPVDTVVNQPMPDMPSSREPTPRQLPLTTMDNSKPTVQRRHPPTSNSRQCPTRNRRRWFAHSDPQDHPAHLDWTALPEWTVCRAPMALPVMIITAVLMLTFVPKSNAKSARPLSQAAQVPQGSRVLQAIQECPEAAAAWPDPDHQDLQDPQARQAWMVIPDRPDIPVPQDK